MGRGTRETILQMFIMWKQIYKISVALEVVSYDEFTAMCDHLSVLFQHKSTPCFSVHSSCMFSEADVALGTDRL